MPQIYPETNCLTPIYDETNYVSTEHARLKRIKPMGNLSCHSDLVQLVTSTLLSGVQMGLRSKALSVPDR
jgi:hypothetical protein